MFLKMVKNFFENCCCCCCFKKKDRDQPNNNQNDDNDLDRRIDDNKETIKENKEKIEEEKKAEKEKIQLFPTIKSGQPDLDGQILGASRKVSDSKEELTSLRSKLATGDFDDDIDKSSLASQANDLNALIQGFKEELESLQSKEALTKIQA